MIYTIERKLAFDAGHRLMLHESKCQYVHGHRYIVTVIASGELDEVGRVIDFGVIKKELGHWIELFWDHNLILNQADEDLIERVRPYCKDKSPYPLPYNPTAENMARYLLEAICPALFGNLGIRIRAIRVDETPNCSAIVEEK